MAQTRYNVQSSVGQDTPQPAGLRGAERQPANATRHPGGKEGGHAS